MNRFVAILGLVVTIIGCEARKQDAAPTEDTELKRLTLETEVLRRQNQERDAARGVKSRRTIGKWEVELGEDRLDKKPWAQITTFGNNSSVLIVRCRNAKTELYITTETTENGSVRFRLDDEDPISQTWSQATDYGALFSPIPIEFASRLAQAKILLFEYHKFHSGNNVLDFQLAGLDKALPEISSTCRWKQTAAEVAARRAAEEHRLAEQARQFAENKERLERSWQLTNEKMKLECKQYLGKPAWERPDKCYRFFDFYDKWIDDPETVKRRAIEYPGK